MSNRESILERIREALKVPAPMPGAHGKPSRPAPEAEAARHISDWLPRVGASFEERARLFATNSADLKTGFHLLDSREAMLEKLRSIASAEKWQKIGIHSGELTGAARALLSLPVCDTSAAYETRDLETCDAGISECDFLVSQTGSVLVSSRSAGGRALSVLPPHHVVLATRGQLLPDLPSSFALLKSRYAYGFPSFISLITGPSRTGDIERVLVLGAHGPKKLTVLCY